MSLDSSEDYPTFGEVEEILVWEDEKMFIVAILEVIQSISQYMAYYVKLSEKEVVRTYHSLPYHGVLHIVTRHGKHYVVNRDTAAVELLD